MGAEGIRARPTLEVIASSIILAVALACALVPSVLAPADPNKIGVGDLLEAPSIAHLMGTDEFGRDILSRVIHSARVELIVSLAGVGLALTIGVPLGLFSAGAGGSMRWPCAQDGLMAFPRSCFWHPDRGGIRHLSPDDRADGGCGVLPRFARLVRGTVLVSRRNSFLPAGVAGRATCASGCAMSCPTQ
jgi:peptide/nickel transport system permease protein